MEISVVIPTYNRREFLRKALDGLREQSLDPHCFEVVVADDGSSDDTAAVAAVEYPFQVRYCRQENQGSAAARNLGAQASQGEVLAYLDDDIRVEPIYLESILAAHRRYDRAIIQGSLVTKPLAEPTPFQRLYADLTSTRVLTPGEVHPLTYRECLSGFFSVKRQHYSEIGAMQDVGGDGRTAWGDIDFGYRAQRLGFEFWQIGGALGFHEDASLANLWAYASRWENTSRTFAKLMMRYPEMRDQLPMFEDKAPIQWGKDPAGLAFSKGVNRLAATPLALQVLRLVVFVTDTAFPALRLRLHPAVLRPLYRLVIGAHLTRGFRAGLQDIGSL